MSCFTCEGSRVVYIPDCWEGPSNPNPCPDCLGSGLTGDELIELALSLGFTPPRGNQAIPYERLIEFIEGD